MLRAPAFDETPLLVELGISTGLFQPHDADALLRRVLEDFHAGHLGEGHHVEVWSDRADAAPAGWTYLAPDSSTDAVWELWWIGVAPSRHGQGIGSELLHAAEERVRTAGARSLLISTSSLPALARTRSFYAKRGYAECGRIPDYYGDGDDRIIFTKRVAPPSNACSQTPPQAMS